MNKNRVLRILKNTLSNYLREITQIAVFIVLTPLIAGRLGVEAFGLWSLIWAVVSFFWLMDLGFANSVIKYVADARGKNDLNRLRGLIATFFWIYVVLGILMIIVAAPLAAELPKLLKIPDKFVDSARTVFLLIMFRSALAMPFGMFSGVLIGYQRQSWANAVYITESVVYAVLAASMLLIAPSLESLAIINFATNVAANLALFILSVTKLEGLSVSPFRFNKKLLRDILSFSTYFFIIQVSLLIKGRVDALIIQAYLSLGAVALYTVALRISEKASVLCRQLTNALTPVIAEMNGADEKSNIRVLFEKGSKLTAAFATPLLLGLFWFAEDLFVVWLGEEYRSAAGASRILLIAMFINAVHGNAANVLTMTGRQRYTAISFIVGQVLNIIISLVLIIPMGISGVAVATLVSTIVTDVFLIQSKAGSIYNIKLFNYYKNTVFPSIYGVLFMLPVLWITEKIITPNSLLRIAGLEFVGIVVFALGFLAFGLNKLERSYFLGQIGRLIHKGRAGQIASDNI